MGANWETQNKVRPGVYGRNTSEDMTLAQVSDRGICAMPMKLDWGIKDMVKLVRGENLLKKIAYSITDPSVFYIKEAFKNARIIYLYNVAGKGVKATATEGGLTVTAKLDGERGNDITVVIEESLDADYEVTVIFGTSEVEKQRIKELKDFTSDFIILEGELEEIAGLTLAGGETGKATNENYIDFLEAVEREIGDINSIGYPGDDETIKELFVSFTRRIREDVGYKIQCILANFPEADNEAVYSINNGVVMGGKTLTAKECVPFVLGAVAGASLRQSLTYFKYEGASSVTGDLQDEGIKEALLNGEMVFTMSRDGNVVIEQDVNTLKSFSKEKPKALRKGRPSRILDNFDKDIDNVFYTYYIGKSDNEEVGRGLIKNEVYKLAKMYEAMPALQNVLLEDFEVFEGDEVDSVFIRYRAQPVDSVDKIYMERVIK